MLAAAKEKLSGMAPGEIARATGFSWDGAVFASEPLGMPFQISWPKLELLPMLEMWHSLTILQYKLPPNWAGLPSPERRILRSVSLSFQNFR